VRLANVTRICHHFIELGLIGVCEAAGLRVSLLEAAVQALGSLEGIGGPGNRPSDDQQIRAGGQRLNR